MARVSIYYAYYPCIVVCTYIYHMLGEYMSEGVNFPLDNYIYVLFDNTVYQQVVGIPLTTNCAPLILNLSLYYNESHFRTQLFKYP